MKEKVLVGFRCSEELKENIKLKAQKAKKTVSIYLEDFFSSEIKISPTTTLERDRLEDDLLVDAIKGDLNEAQKKLSSLANISKILDHPRLRYFYEKSIGLSFAFTTPDGKKQVIEIIHPEDVLLVLLYSFKYN